MPRRQGSRPLLAKDRFVLDIAALIAADELRHARMVGASMTEAFQSAYAALDDVIEIGSSEKQDYRPARDRISHD